MPKLFHRSQKSEPTTIIYPVTTNQVVREAADHETNLVDGVTNVLPSQNENKVHFKTIDHVRTYPLVQETYSFLDSVSASRVVIANTKPVLKGILNSKTFQFVSPVTSFFDNMADSTLNFSDKMVPALKTETYQDLGNQVALPYRVTKQYTKQVSNATKVRSTKYIYKPTHDRIKKFRKYYNEKVYDTHGKPIIRGSLDPVVIPINDRLEMFTLKHFPKGSNVPKDTFCCNFDRSFALGYNLLDRSIPVAENRIVSVSMVPFYYMSHVNSVFNKHLDSKSDLGLKNSWAAALATLSELEKESLRQIKKSFPFTIFTKKEKDDLQDQAVVTLEDGTETNVPNPVSNVDQPDVNILPIPENGDLPHEISVNVE